MPAVPCILPLIHATEHVFPAFWAYDEIRRLRRNISLSTIAFSQNLAVDSIPSTRVHWYRLGFGVTSSTTTWLFTVLLKTRHGTIHVLFELWLSSNICTPVERISNDWTLLRSQISWWLYGRTASSDLLYYSLPICHDFHEEREGIWAWPISFEQRQVLCLNSSIY